MRNTLTVVILLTCLKAGFTEIILAPISKEVELRGSTYFNCTTSVTSKEVQWFHYSVSSTERRIVYALGQIYSPYLGRFEVEKNVTAGECNLVITSIVAQDAGKYECQDEEGKGMNRSAQLIILNTALVCQSNVNLQAVIGPNSCDIEPEQLILTCMVQYMGNEAPILRWELNDNDNQSVGSSVTHDIMTGNLVRYNLTLKPEQIANGSFYVCEMTRTISTISCRTENIKIVGTKYPACVAAEICSPYIKPYVDAIICIFLIILPASIASTILVLWYLSKKPEQTENAGQETVNVDAQAPEFDRLLNARNDHTSKIAELEGMNQKQAFTIKQLEFELNHKQYEEKKLTVQLDKQSEFECQLSKQSDEITELHAKNKDSVDENSRLNARLKVLENNLYVEENIKYAKKPILVNTIITNVTTKHRRKAITGMTILGKELFVAHEKSSVIEVYDSETFLFEIGWVPDGISDPMDIASCKVANCLYIILRECKEDTGSESHVMKLEPNGKLITRWPTRGDHGQLSIYESNVIVCLFEKQLIHEYTNDGKLIQTVPLSPAVGINHPSHAIKVTSTHFAVCHGDATDKLSRVCIVDVQGNILKELREWEREYQGMRVVEHLKFPLCLVADSERSILVVDRDKQRITLLNCILKHRRSFIKEKELDGHPVRMCMDVTKGRLFVAVNTLRSNKEWKDGRVLVFNIK